MDVTIDLSASGLLDAARDLQALADRLQPACDAAAQDVADYAATVARSGAPVDTGELQGSIGTERVENGVDVVCSAPYAAFVEFGTGLGSPAASARTREAMAEAGWVIDEKARGMDGWPFPRDDGSFGITHGQNGSGFMGRAAEEAEDVARDVFAERIGEAMRQ